MTASRSEFGWRLLLFVIVVAFYWKLVFTNQYDWIAGPDMAQQVLPWFEEAARQIQHGRLPLWDTHSSTEAKQSTISSHFGSGAKYATAKFRFGEVERQEVKRIVERSDFRNF